VDSIGKGFRYFDVMIGILMVAEDATGFAALTHGASAVRLKREYMATLKCCYLL